MAAPSVSYAESDSEESSDDSCPSNSVVVSVKTCKITIRSVKGSGRENRSGRQPSLFPSPAIVQK